MTPSLYLCFIVYKQSFIMFEEMIIQLVYVTTNGPTYCNVYVILNTH